MEMRTLVSVQRGLWSEHAAITSGDPGHAFANGFLAGLGLATNEPEYALALWLDQARHMADETFFREFHAGKARSVTERWPVEMIE